MKNAMIIIPTYNERDNIGLLIEAVFEVVADINILIIDDNSPDGTGALCDELAAARSQVQVLHRPRKMGLGTAYREGFRIALDAGMEYILEMDADFSHNPEILKVLLEEVKRHGVVTGSRFCRGISVVNWPLRRLVLSLIASMYVRLVTGLNLSDTTTGYKCFQREVLEQINLDLITSQDYAFQIEMNYWAMRLGYSIKEVPIIFIDRHSGTSKMSTGIINEALFLPWKLRFRDRFGNSPIKKTIP